MLFPIQFPNKESYVLQQERATHSSRLLIPNGEIHFFPTFLSQNEAQYFLAYLIENQENSVAINIDWRNIDPALLQWKNIAWKHEAIRMFGKMVMQPRFTAWYGDEGKSYTYSGLKMSPLPWNEGLFRLKTKIEALSQHSFNSVLLNFYRDGHDHMGWHSDNEAALGKNPVIASLNLGATRRFLFRRNADHTEKIEVSLTNGSLLIMQGETQHFWQHALPKQTKSSGIRINLTFRTIL
jgi:alkylated DNA repair dioxygenase AlkB